MLSWLIYHLIFNTGGRLFLYSRVQEILMYLCLASEMIKVVSNFEILGAAHLLRHDAEQLEA